MRIISFTLAAIGGYCIGYIQVYPVLALVGLAAIATSFYLLGFCHGGEYESYKRY